MINPYEGTPSSPLEHAAQLHTELMQEHPHAYFELAHMRRTGSMGWLTTQDVEDNPKRQLIRCESGATLHKALKRLTQKRKPEIPVVKKLFKLWEEFLEHHNYAYFFLYAKPEEGWHLTISTHHNAEDGKNSQYRAIVSITEPDMMSVITKGIEGMEACKDRLRFYDRDYPEYTW